MSHFISFFLQTSDIATRLRKINVDAVQNYPEIERCDYQKIKEGNDYPLSTGEIVSNKELTMNYMPHEFAIGGVFMPPLLVAGLLGTIAAVVTARLLNRYRLSRYFFYPPLVFVALALRLATVER